MKKECFDVIYKWESSVIYNLCTGERVEIDNGLYTKGSIIFATYTISILQTVFFIALVYLYFFRKYNKK